ncbi:MAG: putative ABC transporter solute-binding protein YclQ precursor [Firmicutes bacterium ADurb.Bin182]|nr:MAG: putative ABC transporter solute-binding protein YclQ precursor [Firmicutes bacterium ADurb.Bin182]
MKKIAAVLISVFFLFAFAACAQKPVPEEPAVEPVTLIDQAGRTVTVEKEPDRIVSGYFISTSACIALGLEDRLAGIEAKAGERNIYKLAAPGLLELPNVGTAKEFDLEGCIALEPDLVILPKKLQDSAEIISGLGIPVLLVSPESHEDLIEAVSLIAASTGTEQRARELISYYSDAEANMKSLTEGAQKPVVYIAGNSSYLSTAPKDMYQASLIRAAGGQNAADSIEGDNWTEVSYEQLLSMDPEVIVIPAEASYTAQELIGDPALAGVKAVKNNNVFVMPSSFEPWDSPVPSGILGTMWLTSVLHEDLYSFDDFTGDVADFYGRFYGFTVDTALITK